MSAFAEAKIVCFMDYSDYPRYAVTADSVVIGDDGPLSVFRYGCVRGSGGDDAAPSRDDVLSYLRSHPLQAAALLATTGHLYYSGSVPSPKSPLVLGVRLEIEDVRSVDADGSEVVVSRGVLVGENAWGSLLESARDAYRAELSLSGMMEEEPPAGTIVCDFTPEGAEDSAIASYEADVEKARSEGSEGPGDEEYLHTDYYKPKRNVFNSTRSGVTGFRDRPLSGDVPWKTFVCPFGVGYPHRFRTRTAAEASFLYEKALRGELDWEAYVADAIARKGGDGRPRALDGVSPLEARRLASDMRNQFAWMRHRILSDNASLRSMRIVSEGAFPPDGSFGMSVYDYRFAPSPAMVLARYVWNPILLTYPSTLCTALALGYGAKEEPRLFAKEEGSLSLLVDGSDCIGGRVPGTVSAMRRVAFKSGGRWRHELRKMPERMTAEAVEADYRAFSRRMGEMLGGVSSSVPVTFVTGGAMGLPELVRRYVLEAGGSVYRWDALSGRPVLEESGVADDGRDGFSDMPDLSVVRFSRDEYRIIHPLFASRVASVSVSEAFPVDEAYDVLSGGEFRSDGLFSRSLSLSSADEAKVREYGALSGRERKERFAGVTVTVSRTVTRDLLSAAGCLPSSMALFTRSDDAYLPFVLERASAVILSGIPVVRSVDLLSAAAQRDSLRIEGETEAATLLGDVHWDEDIFSGPVVRDWSGVDALPGTYRFGWRSPDGSFNSYLTARMRTPVSVGGLPYDTVYDAFVALALMHAGEGGGVRVGDPSQVISALPDSVVNDAVRSAVHLFAMHDGRFQSILDSSGDGDIICPEPHGLHDGRLFVGASDFVGENRFGLALKAERGPVRKLLAARREQAEAVGRRLAEGNAASRRKVFRLRGDGALVDRDSLQDAAWLRENAGGAVFLTGTRSRGEMTLSGPCSFDEWTYSAADPGRLTREVAAAKLINVGYDADQAPRYARNRYVFLFPTDEMTAARRIPPRSLAGSTDLTDVRREMADGTEPVVAFGVPVRHAPRGGDGEGDGWGNPYYGDKDAGMLVDSIILADSGARKVALDHGLSLCAGVYERLSGDRSRVIEERPSLSEPFLPVTWGVIRDDDGHVVRKADGTLAYGYVPNGHESAMCRRVVDRYLSCLRRGRNLPLNCFVLPLEDYSAGARTADGREVTEQMFLSDLRFTLRLANMTAVATGRRLLVPYDGATGLVDLGPNIPARYVEAADAVVRDFIGDASRRSLMTGELPEMTAVAGVESAGRAWPTDVLHVSDAFVRATPDDLVALFGPFRFGGSGLDALSGGRAGDVADAIGRGPVHYVRAALPDGSSFALSGDDSSRFTPRQLRELVTYSSNPSMVWKVSASDDASPSLIANVVDSYVVRSKLVRVEYRLVTSEEQAAWDEAHQGSLPGEGADGERAGFVWLPSSNARLDGIVADGHMIVTRDMSAAELRSALPGNDYPGWVDARDGFEGFVQWRYAAPGGEFGEWRVLDDFALARDTVLLMTHRTYRDPDAAVPRREFVEACFCHLAIVDMGTAFRSMDITEVISPDLPRPKVAESGSGKAPDLWFGRLDCPDFSSWEDFIVCVSEPGKGCEGRYDVMYESLYAPKALLDGYSSGRISPGEFSERYVSEVLAPREREILSDRGLRGLMREAASCGRRFCVEGDGAPGTVSVRTVLAGWLSARGVECRESVADRESLRSRELRSVNVCAASGENGSLDASARRPFVLSDGGGSAELSTALQGATWLMAGHLGVPDSERDGLRKVVLSSDDPERLRSVRKLICARWLRSGGGSAFAEALGTSVRESFVQNPLAASDLISTGDALLTCVSPDGVIDEPQAVALMAVRSEIRKDPSVVMRSGGVLSGISFRDDALSPAEAAEEGVRSADVDATVVFATDFLAPDVRRVFKASRDCGKRVCSVDLPVRKDGGLDVSPDSVALAVESVWSSVGRRFCQGDPVGLNVSGNTGDVLARSGVTQSACDLFVSLVLRGLIRRGMDVRSLRCAGSSGAEEAGAVAGVAAGVRVVVCAPKGWVMRDADGNDVSMAPEEYAGRFAASVKNYDSLRAHVRDFFREGVSPSSPSQSTVRKKP